MRNMAKRPTVSESEHFLVPSDGYLLNGYPWLLAEPDYFQISS